MPNGRRPKTAAATEVFTGALSDRLSDRLGREVERLREAVRAVRRERPFAIDARVALPDRLRGVRTLPEGGRDVSTRRGAIKARVSAGLEAGPRRASHVARRETGIWRRRFRKRPMRDEADLAAHLRYCRLNPVKRGLAARPEDWPPSSIHRDIARGLVEPEWSGVAPEGRYGE